MSDREATLSELTKYFNTSLPKDYWPSGASSYPKCHVVVASHERQSSFSREHGPYAGIGFYQDLLLAIQARSGIAGSIRSSSDLVSELLVYDREMEAIRAHIQQRSRINANRTKNTSKDWYENDDITTTYVPLPSLPRCRTKS